MASTPSNPTWQHANNTPGAAQTPDIDGAFPIDHHPQQGSNTDGQDAIREGKQKAKETMQAQALSRTHSPAPFNNMTNGSAQSNGAAQLSRKRSRDGTQLPVTESAMEPQPAHGAVLLDRYIQRDLLHGAAMIDQAQRSRDLLLAKEKERDFYATEVMARRRADPGSIFGYGFRGFGNGTTNAKPQIVYSAQRGPLKGRKCRQIHINRKDLQRQAEQHEELVPIRLDMELDKLRLRDTFTWNLHEKCINQDVFMDYLLEDLRIPPENLREVSQQIKAEMQEQIQNFYPHVIVEDGPVEAGVPYSGHKDDEMRIQIKLNITIGRITLIDQFEWDINNPLNSPEEFAQSMAKENALSGEFTTAIAHSIREQSQQYTKALYLTNHAFDGRPIEDPELRDNFLPAPLLSAFRPVQSQKDFTPYMYEMSEAELERTETSMMREHRAQKRQLNRRGGPALPDLREKPRTVRSLIVHSVIPGAVETFEMTGIPKTRRGGKGARRSGRNADGEMDSDDLYSEDSATEQQSPAPAAIVNVGGTARTRGMRGAAAQAQANMRAGYGRSATPDSQAVPTPAREPRTVPERSSRLREKSAAVAEEEESLIVRLKISKAKLKAVWDALQAKKWAKEFPLSGYASAPSTSLNTQPGTPARGASGTPNMAPRSLPATRNTPRPNGNHSRADSAGRQPQASPSKNGISYDSRGAVDISHWPGPDDEAPPPPPWLTESIATLRAEHPDDDFMPFMRAYTIDAETEATITKGRGPPTAGGVPAAGTKFQYLPRIRCNDCPGKLYTAVPGKVIQDFSVHLRNRVHREMVNTRKQGGSPQA
ncbi:SWI/SNF chromatin-remodeling complex subunit [Sphaerulina musiva]